MATKASKKKAAVAAEENTEVKEVKKKTAAKKPAARKKAAKPKTASAKDKNINAPESKYPGSYLVIDHPVETEKIYGSHYAVRIGASANGYVEISFNDGEWQPCRYGAGYWWFDWTYFSQGNYSIKARLMDPNGNMILESAPRKCKIC